MADLTFTAGDDAPSIFGTLTVAGEVLDLSGATEVRFQMRPANDRRYVVDAGAAIVTANLGAVRYDPAAGDFGTPGDYIARWRVIWNDDTTQASEPENTITVDPA